MVAEDDYILCCNWSAEGAPEKNPCIFLKQVIKRSPKASLQTVWSQVFADWVQRDATFDRLSARENEWTEWGKLAVQQGPVALTRKLAPYFFELADIYPGQEAATERTDLCAFFPRGDATDPQIQMVDLSHDSFRVLCSLDFEDGPSRDWAHSWLQAQVDRSRTFLRLVDEDGPIGLERLVFLVMNRFRSPPAPLKRRMNQRGGSDAG